MEAGGKHNYVQVTPPPPKKKKKKKKNGSQHIDERIKKYVCVWVCVCDVIPVNSNYNF